MTIIANDVTKTFGTTATLSDTAFSAIGLVTANGDTLTSVTESSTGAEASAPVGSYTIAPLGQTGTGLGNYAIQYQSGMLTVKPAPLTISVVSKSKYAGQPNPALTVIYSGFVNGDSPASLATRPTLATTATTTSGVGKYPIVATGAASPNYAIQNVNGTLTVNPALVTVKDVTVETMTTGTGKNSKTIDVIVVQFSGALEAADAESLANYTIATVAQGNKKSKPVVLTQAVYNASKFTVTLTPGRQPLVLSPPVKLTISAAGLLDKFGRPIDGNDDGQPGGNYVVTL